MASPRPPFMPVFRDYWKNEGGKIQFISSCGHPEGLVKGAQVSVDFGACAIYTHGVNSDTWAKEGNIKAFEEALDGMRKLGVPVGIGAHRLETLEFCLAHGLVPDFWMKTFHDISYWSARPEEGHESKDNNWCVNPQAVIDFMAKREEPWIAYKVLAAGALHPYDGFPFAFEGGADFICVGMYDFQLVEDVNYFNDFFPTVFPNCESRKRPWRA